MFLFLGASNGCVPAAFVAKQFSDKVLSLAFASCVPGREQWGDVSRMQCPVTVTRGSKEEIFGGAASIYLFAQTVHANVFSFWGRQLYEGQDTLRRLASFVADASKPSVAAATASPRRSPRRHKSKSPSTTKKSDKKAKHRAHLVADALGGAARGTRCGPSRLGRGFSADGVCVLR